VRQSVKDAIERLGGRPDQLRPYLQDFSMGVRYTPELVRAQIRAAEEQGVRGWILWNPQNRYSWSAVQAGPIPTPARVSTDPPARARRSPRRRAAAAPEPLPQTPPAQAATPRADAESDAFGAAPSPEAPQTPEVQ
jgi:hypothetical protein